MKFSLSDGLYVQYIMVYLINAHRVYTATLMDVQTLHVQVHVLIVVFSPSGRLAERMMAVLFCWHTQHKSLIGFITTM